MGGPLTFQNGGRGGGLSLNEGNVVGSLNEMGYEGRHPENVFDDWWKGTYCVFFLTFC